MKNFKGELFPTEENINKIKFEVKGLFKVINDYNRTVSLMELFPKNKKRWFQKDGFQKAFIDGDINKDKKYKSLYIISIPNNNGEYTPIYVGISRNTKRRMEEHFKRTHKSNATLLQLIANERDDVKTTIPLIEQDYMKDARLLFKYIENDYLLQLAEIYASIELKTYWNSFKTH